MTSILKTGGVLRARTFALYLSAVMWEVAMWEVAMNSRLRQGAIVAPCRVTARSSIGSRTAWSSGAVPRAWLGREP